MSKQKFSTSLTYDSREEKPRYVADKYGSILRKSVLDVGADKQFLMDYLDDDIVYEGIGLGEGVDQVVDLEEEGVPYEDDAFDCVICLDVLEHIDNLHEVFDDLCRVAASHVIVALPNPWASFMGMLKDGYYAGEERPLKQYYLPTDPPEDRHKWFFGPNEAARFLRERSDHNGANVIDIDQEWSIDSRGKRRLITAVLSLVIDDHIDPMLLMKDTTWAVIRTR